MDLVHYEPTAPSGPLSGSSREGVNTPQNRQDWAADWVQVAVPAISPDDLTAPVDGTADGHG